VLGEDVANMDLPVVVEAGDQLRNLSLMGITYYPFDAGHSRQLFRRPLGIAAGHQDAGCGVLAMDAAHGLAHVVVGGCGDRAGVEDYEVGLIALLNGNQALFGEQRLNGSSIRLCGAASEILNVEVAQPLFYSLKGLQPTMYNRSNALCLAYLQYW
jgi:hypothetical protein